MRTARSTNYDAFLVENLGHKTVVIGRWITYTGSQQRCLWCANDLKTSRLDSTLNLRSFPGDLSHANITAPCNIPMVSLAQQLSSIGEDSSERLRV